MTQNASQRRFQKRADDLGELLSTGSPRFTQLWATLCRGWIGEIHARARAWRQGASQEAHPGVFEVYEHACRLVNATTKEKKVSPKAEHARLLSASLNDLRHLCAQAVACATDPHLYRFTEDCTTRVRRAGGRA